MGGARSLPTRPSPRRSRTAVIARSPSCTAAAVCRSVITQNVDGLHQASGLPDERVIELHGNSTYARCLDCSRRYELEPILDNFRRDERLPLCDACGGIVKTATISFGQSMPVAAMQRSEEETERCDVFLATGSSLVVYPAAGFPALAKQRGATLVILKPGADPARRHRRPRRARRDRSLPR